jgi:phage/plasmid-associated DNA primase
MLRKWYVETFVLDSTNNEILPSAKVPSLEEMYAANSWVTTEHAAVGHRLLFATNPDSILRHPDLLEPDHWGNEDEVATTMMRVFRLWEEMRYDPDGENWYTAVKPGQWKRHGKGGPSASVIEERLNTLLIRMDPTTNEDLYAEWPVQMPVTEGKSMDETRGAIEEIQARLNGSRTRFKKFRNASLNKMRLRQVLERSSIMFLDTNSLNQIKTVSPFGNGVLALVDSEYRDTLNTQRRIKMGQLLPMNIEYMVTNANPIQWNDPEGKIPKAAGDALTMSGDYVRLQELEDELMLGHCPTYWSFLTHAFPDPDVRSAFLRLYGAAMYGTNIKIVAALIGEPNAGKDTVLNWLNFVMPGQVATLPFSAFTPHGDDDRGFAPLRGARVATVSGEVGEGRGSKLLAEKIKTVSSGGGKIRVAEKYEKPTDIWFDGMLLLQGNTVPQIAGGDRALYTNRLVAVEFEHPFALVSRNYDAEYRAEAPWFAQVLFLNYLQYQAEGGGMRGIDPPESWRMFAKEFADASNPHGFLEACFVKSPTYIPTSQFHAALSAMVAKFGSPYPLGANYWPKRLRTLGWQMKGPNSVRKRVVINGKQVWCYYIGVDSEFSDGMFTDTQWEAVLKDAAVNA